MLHQVHLAMSGIQTRNISGDMHWLQHDKWCNLLKVNNACVLFRSNLELIIQYCTMLLLSFLVGPSWSYGSWIYNYLCNQCLSPLMLLVRISNRARCTRLHVFDKVYQLLATGRWFSPGPPVSSTNKTDRHDITEILLKVAFSTIKQKKHSNFTKISREVTFRLLVLFLHHLCQVILSIKSGDRN